MARNIEVYYFGQSCNYVSPRATPYKPLLLLSIEITPWSHQATTNQPPNMKQTTQRTKSQTPSKTNFRDFKINQIKRLPKIPIQSNQYNSTLHKQLMPTSLATNQNIGKPGYLAFHFYSAGQSIYSRLLINQH